MTARSCRLIALALAFASCAHDPAKISSGATDQAIAALQLPQPTSARPVVAAAIVVPDVVAPGDDATLVVVARIAPGWHIYPLEGAATTRATKIAVEVPAGVELADAWIAPAPGQGPDGAAYEGEVRFTRSLRVHPGATTGSQPVHCALTFEACDMSSCRPPQTLELETRFEVVNPD